MTAVTDHYLGIDVHKRKAQIAVLDEEGEMTEEVRIANANLDELAQKYAGEEAALEEYAIAVAKVGEIDGHLAINHDEHYVVGDAHTNSCENRHSYLRNWLRRFPRRLKTPLTGLSELLQPHTQHSALVRNSTLFSRLAEPGALVPLAG